MERLQKVMADAGIASRRQCEGMIYKGLVKVNGVIVKEMPVMVDQDVDEIIVSGKKLIFEPKVYYLLHKPKKVVCTNYDPDDRRKACDLMPGVRERVYPVGRLDADSNGLLLMTNDGELANQLTHPKYGVPKTYIVEINSRINGADIEKLQKGFFIATNGRASMDRIKILKRDQKRSLLEITLCEGRNRQIKRMLARLGHKVKKLTRVKFGPLTLRGLGIGQYRALTKREVAMLRKMSTEPKSEKEKVTAKKTSKAKATSDKAKATTKPKPKAASKKVASKAKRSSTPPPSKTVKKSVVTKVRSRRRRIVL